MANTKYNPDVIMHPTAFVEDQHKEGLEVESKIEVRTQRNIKDS